MKILTIASGSIYESLADKSKGMSESLGHEHHVVRGDGGKSLKVNFWKHLSNSNEPLLLLDADAYLTSSFKEPNITHDVMGVDASKWACKRVRWADRLARAGASSPHHDLRINSGVVFFRNSDIARRVGKKWASYYTGDLDEPALWRALLGEDVGLLPDAYNQPSEEGQITHRYDIKKS